MLHGSVTWHSCEYGILHTFTVPAEFFRGAAEQPTGLNLNWIEFCKPLLLHRRLYPAESHFGRVLFGVVVKEQHYRLVAALTNVGAVEKSVGKVVVTMRRANFISYIVFLWMTSDKVLVKK